MEKIKMKEAKKKDKEREEREKTGREHWISRQWAAHNAACASGKKPCDAAKLSTFISETDMVWDSGIISGAGSGLSSSSSSSSAWAGVAGFGWR